MTQTNRVTLAQLKIAAKELGCTVRKVDGEYRINLKGYSEATAYYTNDASDALGTMQAMHTHNRGSRS